MKSFNKVAVGGLLWLAFSAAAFGDTLYLTQTENVDQGGQFTGYLTSNPAATLIMYCIDYRNELVTPVSVNVTTLSDAAEVVANTRYGSTTTTTASTFDTTVAPSTYTAEQRYAMAAWLTTQYTFTSGVTSTDESIQGAIWGLLDVQQGSSFTNGGNVPAWVTNAENWLAAEISSGQLSSFESTVRIYTASYVAPITDLNQNDSINRYTAEGGSGLYRDSQEMIGVVAAPEPATLAMMGAGLLAIGLFRKRTKNV